MLRDKKQTNNRSHLKMKQNLRLDLSIDCFSFMIFGLSRIALTKLDILDTIPEIKVGVAYTVDGKPLHSFPGKFSCFFVYL